MHRLIRWFSTTEIGEAVWFIILGLSLIYLAKHLY